MIKQVATTKDKYLDNRGYQLDLLAYGRNGRYYTRSDSLLVKETGIKGFFNPKSFIFMAGIAYQQLQNRELEKDNWGELLGVGYSFPFGLYSLVTVKHWQNYGQIEIVLRQRIGNSGFTILAGAERLLNYQEVRAGFLYTFKRQF